MSHCLHSSIRALYVGFIVVLLTGVWLGLNLLSCQNIRHQTAVISAQYCVGVLKKTCIIRWIIFISKLVCTSLHKPQASGYKYSAVKYIKVHLAFMQCTEAVNHHYMQIQLNVGLINVIHSLAIHSVNVGVFWFCWGGRGGESAASLKYYQWKDTYNSSFLFPFLKKQE